MFLSPTPTPSKSANVEKLLSLQKSTRHLSDADILSVAAEASAMKRQQARNAYNLENVEPNSRTLPKRLFDISECSKSSAGFYESPEKSASVSNESNAGEDSASDSDNDSDNDEQNQQDTNEQAEKHYAQILQIVNNKMAKVSRKNALANTTADSVTQNSNEGQNGLFAHDDSSYAYEAPAEHENNAEPVVSTSLESNFPTELSVGAIKTHVMRHILSVINTGTYDEILALRGIGKVRALRIFTERNSGYTFSTLEDFADCVNMNEKTLVKFLQANAADIMV
eukprot:gene19494-22162_t